MEKKSILKKILSYFLQGLIYIGPIGFTIYCIYVLFQYVDSILAKYIIQLLGFPIPGLGIILIFFVISLIGFLGSTYIFRPVISAVDTWVSKAPFIKIVYTSVKDLLSAFVGQKKRFTKPVLVKIGNHSCLEKLGFVTNEDLSELGLKPGKIAVYCPHSYAWSGNLFIVPVENVTPIDASSTEVMKYILSAGVTKLND